MSSPSTSAGAWAGGASSTTSIFSGTSGAGGGGGLVPILRRSCSTTAAGVTGTGGLGDLGGGGLRVSKTRAGAVDVEAAADVVALCCGRPSELSPGL